MMYFPTSKAAKFKAKGWTDMFGGRIAKSGGAQLTNMLKNNMTALMAYGTLIGLGITGIWIVVAMYVGKKNEQLLKEGKGEEAAGAFDRATGMLTKLRAELKDDDKGRQAAETFHD